MAWLSKKWDEIVKGPPPFRKSYALLLGVSDYRHMEKLSLVNDDLIKMENFLLSLGFHVVRAQNDRLTMANVRSPRSTSSTSSLLRIASSSTSRVMGSSVSTVTDASEDTWR